MVASTVTSAPEPATPVCVYVMPAGAAGMFTVYDALMHVGSPNVTSFGQTSILDRGPRPVTAQAGDEGVDYLVLERGPFMDLLIDRPAVVNGLFIVLARRLRELVELTGGAEPTARGTAVPLAPQPRN